MLASKRTRLWCFNGLVQAVSW